MTDQHRFSNPEIAAVYRAIYQRRDVRHFTSEPVDPAVLRKILFAAHHAPSVGFMQPWRFIRVTRTRLREEIYELVEAERRRTADALGARKDEFMKLKVEGVMECAELVVVGLMPDREQHVFGRRTMPDMDLASVACAIQNLWLASRAEGLAVGWVSIYDPNALMELLAMPDGTRPIAILCIGHTDEFMDKPMLEKLAWAERAKLDEYLMEDRWED